MDDGHQLVSTCKRHGRVHGTGLKPVLMMLDGLATTHDPAGHNLPHRTPAMLPTIPHGIPDPADRVGIRNSDEKLRGRGEHHRATECAAVVWSRFPLQHDSTADTFGNSARRGNTRTSVNFQGCTLSLGEFLEQGFVWRRIPCGRNQSFRCVAFISEVLEIVRYVQNFAKDLCCLLKSEATISSRSFPVEFRPKGIGQRAPFVALSRCDLVTSYDRNDREDLEAVNRETSRGELEPVARDSISTSGHTMHKHIN